jgi:hypothetical protein
MVRERALRSGGCLVPSEPTLTPMSGARPLLGGDDIN